MAPIVMAIRVMLAHAYYGWPSMAVPCTMSLPKSLHTPLPPMDQAVHQVRSTHNTARVGQRLLLLLLLVPRTLLARFLHEVVGVRRATKPSAITFHNFLTSARRSFALLSRTALKPYYICYGPLIWFAVRRATIGVLGFLVSGPPSYHRRSCGCRSINGRPHQRPPIYTRATTGEWGVRPEQVEEQNVALMARKRFSHGRQYGSKCSPGLGETRARFVALSAIDHITNAFALPTTIQLYCWPLTLTAASSRRNSTELLTSVTSRLQKKSRDNPTTPACWRSCALCSTTRFLLTSTSPLPTPPLRVAGARIPSARPMWHQAPSQWQFR